MTPKPPVIRPLVPHTMSVPLRCTSGDTGKPFGSPHVAILVIHITTVEKVSKYVFRPRCETRPPLPLVPPLEPLRL